MYTPKHFELDAERAAELLRTAHTAQLVTAHESGPVATLLPVCHRPGEGYGALIFHVTRTNSQWKDVGLGEALAIVSGPDGYIDPAWYAAHAQAPSVPTWNYVTVHAYGRLVVHDDAQWVRGAVDDLSARYGYDSGLLDETTMERQLRATVGLELPIARIEAKAKLNQNRRPDDVAGVIDGLRAAGEAELAAEMAEISLPYAQARAALIADVAARGIGA